MTMNSGTASPGLRSAALPLTVGSFSCPSVVSATLRTDALDRFLTGALTNADRCASRLPWVRVTVTASTGQGLSLVRLPSQASYRWRLLLGVKGYLAVVMTVRHAVAPPLAPIADTLRAMRARHGDGPVHGLLPDLVQTDRRGWVPAARLVDGTELPALLDAAKQRWSAQPPTAAALAWKTYVYWASLPAVLGYASARRVPLPHPDNLLIRYADHRPFLTVALYAPTIAVLPDDPLAHSDRPDITVVSTETDLLAALRDALWDQHLEPLLERLRARVNLGRRTLSGSLASGVAYGLAMAAHALPGQTTETIAAVLGALGVADLIELRVSRPDPASADEIFVQRRTCCLAFTLPEPRICPGCCIRPS
jgi:Ferric iron reductase FhuF-like transporter